MIHDALDGLTAVALAIEAGAAVVLTFLNWREVRFLNSISPEFSDPDDWPLFDALNFRAAYITLTGLYLLVTTLLAASGVMLGEIFPPIRAINGALILGLLAGPLTVGRALRRRAERRANGS